MPKIQYENKNFKPATLAIIDQANAIIGEYAALGYDLTLRQLYYQFVSRDLIANKQTEYKRLGGIISDGRRAGLIDWSAITDRTRNLRGLGHFESPAEVVQAAADSYRLDKWASQHFRVEIWVEKDALAGVFERVGNALDIPYFSCRGYTSDSEMWSAAMRLSSYRRGGQVPLILHFGDHDPSGIDMTRDIEDRLQLFARRPIEVRRLALTMEQIEQYDPPPNPAKETDSRFVGYQDLHGDESWELDALEPTVLANLVRAEVREILELGPWEDVVQKENREKALLAVASDHWSSTAERLAEQYAAEVDDKVAEFEDEARREEAELEEDDPENLA